jgi:prepilin-type N-terminal cleavage/methylation domain-containing protein
MTHFSHRAQLRRAFTLVEMLVVIAIIGILLSLTVGAVYKFVEGQRVTGTENVLRTFDKVLTMQWKKVVEDARYEEVSPAVTDLAKVNASDPVGNAVRARVLWVKFRLTEAFPQSYAEVAIAASGKGIYGTDSSGRPWLPVRKYMANYAKAMGGKSMAINPATESAACLYLALIVNRGGTMLDEPNLANFIGDTDGDGVKELIDGWGNAIHFQRFPIGNTDLVAMNPRGVASQASPTLANFGDPLDPEGALQQDKWYLSNNAATFTGLCNHPFPNWPIGPQPYWIPILVANGRDEILGTGDDILSYRLKVGVAGY